MSKNHLINDMVRKTAFTVPPTAYLSEAYRIMKNRSLEHVTVVEDHKIVGIISRKAVKQLGFGYEFEGHDDVEMGIFDMLQANQVMERDPPQVDLSATVGEVAARMAEGAYTALPVVFEGQPVGIVDIHDIVRFLLEAS
ncbi:CBS domain-containing protein [Parapedobacter sp. 10938]|uniref:CBS domain-containing protein n=1 Tax=Parapedobacter flavus TaxID=3110225 RepID=UPI002DB8C28F|nr:CBS domain-containing protein [Parapedobacter sp. 10938]MEC3880817.1 CBS domain-containing protein [Parapedobacter sp. 10938]